MDEVRAIASDKFGKIDVPNIHLDSDGTEVDDEDYFQTLEPNTELIAVFEGEQWIDVSFIIISFFEHRTDVCVKLCQFSIIFMNIWLYMLDDGYISKLMAYGLTQISPSPLPFRIFLIS